MALTEKRFTFIWRQGREDLLDRVLGEAVTPVFNVPARKITILKAPTAYLAGYRNFNVFCIKTISVPFFHSLPKNTVKIFFQKHSQAFVSGNHKTCFAPKKTFSFIPHFGGHPMDSLRALVTWVRETHSARMECKAHGEKKDSSSRIRTRPPARRGHRQTGPLPLCRRTIYSTQHKPFQIDD